MDTCQEFPFLTLWLVSNFTCTTYLLQGCCRRCLVEMLVTSYRPQRSCGKVIFSQACVKNSVHGMGGVCLSACWDIHPLGRHPPGQTVRAGIDMATAADGTHPTGMHSFLKQTFQKQILLSLAIDRFGV